MIEFGREICSRLEAAEAREWLVTNGVGGFAMGTVGGLLTRRYHGLLIAAFAPPLGRTLLLAKLDEDVKYDGQQYDLSVNRWAGGAVEQDGIRHLERFHLEGTTPVWTYAVADALLEKRVWMELGANTTYVQYRLRRGSGPLELYAKALVNYRDYHQTTILNEWQPEIEAVENGLRIALFEEARPLYLLSRAGQVWPDYTWYEDYFLSLEEYRGQNDVVEDHVHVGVFGHVLQPGESFTLVASTEAAPDLDGAMAYRRRAHHERSLLAYAARTPTPAPAQLVLAADQFLVRRDTPQGPDGCTVIAGYPWFSDWGRDTMIALPGLTLGTGRPQLAARILKTYAHFVDRGILPNRFPDQGETPEYNTVDATLWYFEAIRAYLQHTDDDALLQTLFSVLEEIVEWHRRGTRYNIHLDESDGLLYAGAEGVQLTWMDAKVEEWVVTPRAGKAVEVNALWYNALRNMADFARRLGRDAERYEALAQMAQVGFQRFWSDELGYCYDVLDGPSGKDGALRPNQIFAVSLPHSPLRPAQQKAVVDVCARRLLTSFGLRTLAPDAEAYIGSYGGDQEQRDAAYHQGTVWSWLMGPFVTAHLRVYGDRPLARSFLAPLMQHLMDAGVGSVSEIFDGDAPFHPRGCTAQAWGVAELIRAWQLTK
ncbi:MAG TPA: amylo-alpha-1,6-glucosidase [Candidatus Sulfomarinibacteraceae bacterium]|nr:amylo-alpha-1,6-glucosidase [Candidatus Sulfomarinibacteraceae bacterium]